MTGGEMGADAMICGGIDLGGTKIEARLFEGAEARTVETRRIPTPRDSYAGFLDGLCAQIDWLAEISGRADLPVGIAVPGIVNPDTDMLFAANIVASGQPLGRDLAARYGRGFSVVNDCMAFTLSEADGGAGEGHDTVVGLILGTGVGAGFSAGRVLPARHGGIAVEIGHVAAPASALARHGLPLLTCGCGRSGCLETYVSGTGLANIAEAKLGQRLSAETLVAENHQDCLEIWADITGECLVTLQLTLAPRCIVLGGGVSKMPGVTDILRQSMARHMVTGMELPQIVTAAHGDSSGARGAALMAVRS